MEATLSETAARFEILPNMVSLWKREAVEGMSSLFTRKANRHDVSQETRIRELHEKIGQPTPKNLALDGHTPDEAYRGQPGPPVLQDRNTEAA